MFGIFKAAKEQLQQAKQAQVLNLPPEKQTRVVNLQQAKQARAELTVALEAIGINFMKMNPVIHNALLMEATATSTEEAIAHFIAALDALKTSSASRDAKARGLRAFYAYRARQFSG
jgi:glycine cleavage system protein P-like pyridoxal-binding family